MDEQHMRKNKFSELIEVDWSIPNFYWVIQLSSNIDNGPFEVSEDYNNVE